MLDELDVTDLTDDGLFEYRTALATLHADKTFPPLAELPANLSRFRKA